MLMLIAAALALLVALCLWRAPSPPSLHSTLTAEEAERMAGFCAFGLTWRDFRHVIAIERRAVRPSRH
jgi:hypothetical protein